ncbi:MAG: hypothetical protein M1290_07365 [Candidatus Thermoplasmatota archaeon]|jgi:hypothetical protein|nr:hypothetical protein [Candidatus Thermoplasmatota archaeon]MCL5790262.1 hypothetical protein [Candidatus Thermoplasmatota archaeon]
MNDYEAKRELWITEMELASLRFEYYGLITGNRIMAIKLFGYRSQKPEDFPEELTRRMEFYLKDGRE